MGTFSLGVFLSTEKILPLSKPALQLSPSLLELFLLGLDGHLPELRFRAVLLGVLDSITPRCITNGEVPHHDGLHAIHGVLASNGVVVNPRAERQPKIMDMKSTAPGGGLYSVNLGAEKFLELLRGLPCFLFWVGHLICHANS